eukprot:2976558-Pyramimonas_sp.AAC.1
MRGSDNAQGGLRPSMAIVFLSLRLRPRYPPWKNFRHLPCPTMSNNKQHYLLMPGKSRKNIKLTKKPSSNHARYPNISTMVMTLSART